MTPPTPTDVGIPISFVVVGASALLTLIGVTFKLLYNAMNRRIKEKTEHLHESVVQLDKRVSAYFKAHERLRDKWDDFLREYLKIDNTRGQKVDALFRVVDQMDEAVKQIPRNINSKLDEAFTRSLSEVKLYARDQIHAALKERP